MIHYAAQQSTSFFVTVFKTPLESDSFKEIPPQTIICPSRGCVSIRTLWLPTTTTAKEKNNPPCNHRMCMRENHEPAKKHQEMEGFTININKQSPIFWSHWFPPSKSSK